MNFCILGKFQIVRVKVIAGINLIKDILETRVKSIISWDAILKLCIN